MTGVSGVLMTLSTCAPWWLFLPMYQTHDDDGMDAVIAYASKSLTKAESHSPTSWNFSPSMVCSQEIS